MAARAENRESLIAAIGALMLTDDTEAWIERLAPEGIVVAGVQSLDAALDGPLVADRAMVAKVATAHGLLRLVANPIRFDGEDSARYGEPPLLGAANAEFGIGSGPDPA
jgi:crotonobetainyl-CoA:carnitine CoA-transferase CaiB-like acyl-CoA transferase